MLDALVFRKSGSQGFLFVASEVTDGVDLAILLNLLKSTFPTNWLFTLNSFSPHLQALRSGTLSSLSSLLGGRLSWTSSL